METVIYVALAVMVVMGIALFVMGAFKVGRRADDNLTEQYKELERWAARLKKK